MKIISERRSVESGNPLISAIIDHNGQLFKIHDGSPTQLYIWSQLNGWLFIDYGDRKKTIQEHIDQFIHIMKAYTNEKRNSESN
jgi:hypothetical protein